MIEDRNRILTMIDLAIEHKLPPPEVQFRDKDAGGHGSYKKGESGAKSKVSVYHGTSKEVSEKILKEGLKGAPVFATTEKETALMYGREKAVSDGSKFIAIVTVPDAEKAGFADLGVGRWCSASNVSADLISGKVEVYRVSNVSDSGKVIGGSAKVFKRSLQSDTKSPMVMYAVVIIDGDE